jgi:hypothetical protein
MSTPFPTEWRILPSHNFEDFSTILPSSPDTNRQMVLMLQLDNNHKYSGNFRIRYAGGEDLNFRFPIAHIIPTVPETFQNLHLDFSGSNDDISPPRSSTTTPWMDVEELIRMRVVLLSNDQKQEVNPEALVTFLQSTATDKEPVGAAVRWTVDVDASKRFHVQLQCLPTPAKLLQKSHLQGENAVSVILGSSMVNVQVFEDPTIEGPVPIFFSDDPLAANAHLTDHPITVREDIATVNVRFLRHETMTMMEAQQYLKKNRRAAKGVSAFPPVRSSAAKRRRTTQNVETGQVIICQQMLHIGTTIL